MSESSDYVVFWANRLHEKKYHYVEHLARELGRLRFEQFVDQVRLEFALQKEKPTLGGYFIKKLKETPHETHRTLYEYVYVASGERDGERERTRRARRKRKTALMQKKGEAARS